MNAEQLNIIARGILQLTGLSPEEIDMQVKQQRQAKQPKSVKAPSIPTRQEVDASRQAKTRYSGNTPKPVSKNVKTLLQQSVKESGITKKGVGRAAGVASALTDLTIRIRSGQDPLTAITDVALGTIGGIGGGIIGGKAGPVGGVAGNIGGYTVGSNIRPALFGEATPTSSRGEGRAANRTRPQPAALPETPVSTDTTAKRQLSNIPPAEAQPGSPSYVEPPAPATPAAIPTASGNQTAPTAPVRPDYNSMSELERLKIWAMTNRKMIESVGTRQQLQILQRALGGSTNQQLRDAGQATYNRGSA